MSDPDAGKPADIETATRRLSAALDALQEAVEQRCDLDGDQEVLATRAHALSADRAHLADQLDGAMSRSRMLERVNRDVSARLDAAIATIRSVIDSGEST
jgi:hypothetical protein